MATGSNESEAGASRPPRRLGRYTLLKRVAKGGMGEVLLAATSGIEGAERPVIVKMIREEHRSDASFRARFLDEARVQAQLSHSGVASILDATTDEATGEPYVVVEHVDGRNLGDVRARALATGTRVDWAESVAVAQLIAESLAHVHDRRDPMGQPLAIVHRDLSPQNVMVAFTGEVKLIDFGTARGQNRRCHTVAGVVFAKPGYVAPEVANGDSGDFRVDLYALGVMLWELCASRRFLEGDASDHLAAVAANKRDLPPVAESVGAPIELDAAIVKLTSHDREDRYASARDAARDLATLLGSSLPVPGGERGVRPRVAALLGRLFPGETARFRRDFARLVENARKDAVSAAAAPLAPPAPPSAPSMQAASADDAPTDAVVDLSLPLNADPPAPEPAAEPVDASLLPGTRWRLLRALGRGSTSVVWEAEHADVGRRAALKVHAGGEGGRSRFRIEARALTRVEGPFVARLKEAGVASDGRPFTVTELLDGQTLDAWARQRAPLTPANILEVARKLLVSLEGLHATGLIHRDLKPENVFCCASDGTVRLLDLGIARDLGEAEEQDPPSGGALALHGTPAYMAPEQASGVADERSDIYALGCIMYELLAGSLPFEGQGRGAGDGDDVVGVLEAKAKGSPEPLAERAANRDIPKEIDDLVMRALARHPSVRFATAKAMREAIEDVESAPQRKRSSRRRIGFGALAAAMALGAAIFAMPMFPQTAGIAARIKGAISQPAPVVAAAEELPTGLDALVDAPPAGDGGDVLDLLPPEVAEEERALRALEDAGDEAADLADEAVADQGGDELVRQPGEGEDHFGEGEAVAPKPQKKKRRAQKSTPERDRQGDKKAKPKGKGDGKSDDKGDKGSKADKKSKPKADKSDDKPRKKKKGKSRDAGVDG